MNAITPLQRWTRDDWVIPCTLRDNGGAPINLTGSILVAELWLAGAAVFQPLTVGNGGIVRVSDAAGQFTVVASRIVTAPAISEAARAQSGGRTRVLIARIDTLGRRQTLGVVPIEVFDGAEGVGIDDTPTVTLVSQSSTFSLVVATSQGPAGPSSIPAAQISDASETGRALVRAADAAAARRVLALGNAGRTAVRDVNYAVKATDAYVGVETLTAPRTITLPLASAYPGGAPLWIADESGASSTARSLTIAAAGTDQIAGQPNVVIASPYQKLAFHSNETNLWTF